MLVIVRLVMFMTLHAGQDSADGSWPCLLTSWPSKAKTMGATYTRGFPNPLVWPLRSCLQLKSHPVTYTRGATYTRVITVCIWVEAY